MPFCKTNKFTVFSNFFRNFFPEKYEKKIFLRFSKNFSEKDGLVIILLQKSSRREITLIMIKPHQLSLKSWGQKVHKMWKAHQLQIFQPNLVDMHCKIFLKQDFSTTHFNMSTLIAIFTFLYNSLVIFWSPFIADDAVRPIFSKDFSFKTVLIWWLCVPVCLCVSLCVFVCLCVSLGVFGCLWVSLGVFGSLLVSFSVFGCL